MTRLTRIAPGRSVATLALALGLAAAVPPAPAQAVLIKSDFATLGDGGLITDTLTNLEYLSPFVTRGLSINQIQGGHSGFLTTEGFRYAGATTVQGMIDTYFPGTITTNPGTVAGFAVATAFFDMFGLNAWFFCNSGFTDCPRTQGYAIDGVTATGLGMIRWGNNLGYQILHSNPVAAVAAINDIQMGHWLIRDVAVVVEPDPEPVAEPATMMVLGGSIAGLLAMRRRRNGGLGLVGAPRSP